VKAFSNPEEGLAYLKATYTNQLAPFTVVFVDINMPAFSGWEFLEEFDQFPCSIKDRVRICMLSSSVDIRDKERAYNDKNVFDYIEKPLTIQAIDTLVKKLLIEESL
jgi:CheY-like chemotaxis protein